MAHSKRTFWTTLLTAILSLFLVLAIAASIGYTYVEYHLPNVQVLKDAHMQVPLRIYSSDNQLIAQYGSLRRMPVSLDQIPKPLINAVLATEDARYYEHPGIDIIGIARAAVAVITTGKKVQGASTITMQVARNFFLTRKKTYWRKIREILLALKIDKELSKDKVLELYLNKVYFGKRAYGVAAAARVYYGKPLNQLTLAQMAMIAGLPQAPSRNNPLNNPTQALLRRNHVLERMKTVGFINSAQYEAAIKEPITAKFHGEHVQLYAPYFAEMVRQAMLADFGKAAYDRGYKVYTTLSSTDQTAAKTALQNGLIHYSKRHGFRQPIANWGSPDQANLTQWQQALNKIKNIDGLQPAAVVSVGDNYIHAFDSNGDIVTIPWQGLSWARRKLPHGRVTFWPKHAGDIVSLGDVVWVRQHQSGQWALSQMPLAQGAIISLNPQTGAILALSGGFDFKKSNFNRVTQAKRQPGSGFKPFIYSAALDKGYTLASMINDAPIVIHDSGENSLWRPHNDTNEFYGPTRLKVGLAQSRNLVSIRLLRAIGIPYALDYVKHFGFDPNQLPHTLSLALGSGTVTPMQMATGYAVFANGGFRVKPFFIDHIENQSGKTIYQAAPPAPQRVISAQNAYLMNDALQSVIQHGTGRAALKLKRQDLAGKTGTTNKQVDGWFTGFNGQVLTSVWVGNDNLTSIHEYGAQAALPIWIDYMRQALQGQPESTLPQPDGIVTVKIDKSTGLLAPPGDKHAMFEQFREIKAPTHYANAPTEDRPAHSDSDTSNTDTADDTPPIF